MCALEARAFPWFYAVGIGVVLRDRPLIFSQNINAESFSRVQVGVRLGFLVDAYQHQQGIERDRGKGVRGHALHQVFIVHGDDGHTRRKASQSAAELFLICGHGVVSELCVSELYHDCLIFAAARFRYHQNGWREFLVATEMQMSVTAGASECRLEGVARGEALRWINAPEGELAELFAHARAARDRFKPGIITYSRKVFIPLTNLCRDYCGYCTFRRDPGQTGAHTMTPDEVLAVARAGEKLGCTEALFSLGDKPELIFPEMRETLCRLGYRSTLHYLEAMCELVLRETTLLPHPNPGLMSAEWIARLAAVSPSMGLMLETTNGALLQTGAAHDNAPDKVPAKRLRTIEEAGKLGVPFTTGILIGIGESREDRVDALLAIRDLHERYGHIQEVIIQNFRAKPEIPMQHWPEPGREEMMCTIAVARLLMPNVNIQAPPNLSDPDYEELLDAGINDWGGVSPLTPDFINPERPWPHLDELAARTRAQGFELRQRLPVYEEFAHFVLGPVRPRERESGLLQSQLHAALNSQSSARSAA